MKKFYKYLVLSPILLGSASGLTSCANSASNEKLTLKIINSEDYIYLDEEDHSNDLVEQFKRYVKGLANDGVIDSKYKNVDVVYDTSDTNETLYSELQTGKSDYDLINVSDYMAQKMVSDGLVIPLYKEGETRADKIPNYETYASNVLKNRLDEIKAPIRVKNPDTGKMETQYVELADYAVGYMWGTLGILFNPEYSSFSRYSKDEVINDMHESFSALWNKKYNGSISIKNSMRDTFAAGLLHTYENYEYGGFKQLSIAYRNGELTADEYLEKFSEVFNGNILNENGDKIAFSKVVDSVQNELQILKDNIFGLEVDSGKQDIVTGKIGVNLAWSGDAVYSMDQAEDGTLVGENQSELYYCVPEVGSNLWFDVWVTPKNSNRSEERRELALMFLDFLSDPVNATQNMDYTGYTSFIGGDSILELVRDWYDMRTDEIYEEVETKKYVYEYYQVYGVGTGGDDDFFALDYPDFMKDTHKVEKDAYSLYYFVPTEELEEPTSVADLIAQNKKVFVLDEDEEPTDVQKTYADLTIVNADELEGEYDVDLSYFFNGTLVEYTDNYDTVFYSDNYFYDLEVSDADGYIHDNCSVGRQFFTQYPDEETLTHCAVMRDFGENNTLVMRMWEEFKSDPLPTPALVIFLIIIASAIGFVALIVANKLIVNKIRKKRKAANAANKK